MWHKNITFLVMKNLFFLRIFDNPYYSKGDVFTESLVKITFLSRT